MSYRDNLLNLQISQVYSVHYIQNNIVLVLLKSCDNVILNLLVLKFL